MNHRAGRSCRFQSKSMTNPFAADPQSTPVYSKLAEEDVRKKGVQTMRLSFRALAASMIGLALWLSLIGSITYPFVLLATPIF
jgi:hypothetical protein